MNAQIVIQLDEGQVRVNAPMHDPILCLGLLEVAKDVVRAAAAQEQRRVMPVSGLPPGLRKMEG